MKTRLSLLLLLGILTVPTSVSLATPGAYPADNDWIAVRGDSERDLFPDSESAVVLVLVELDDSIDRTSVQLRLLEVRVGKRTDRRLLEAFKVEPALTDTAQIVIKADLTSEVMRHGTYSLLVEASVADDTTRPVDLTLTINHPEATLQTISTRNVEVVHEIFGDYEMHGGYLFLRESSNNSWVTDLTIHPQSFVDASQKPVDVTLSFQDRSLTLRPGGSMTAGINLAGDFPLGETNGTAEIVAPQLKEPVVVQFEVNSRRTATWIWLLILLGVLLGVTTRVWLKKVVDRSEARLNGIEVRERMQRALQRHPDEDFQSAVNTAVERLNRELEKDDVDEIKKGTTDAETALAKALEDLSVATETITTRLAGLALISDTRLWLPDAVSSVLSAGHTEIAAAKAEIESGYITKAIDRVDTLDTTLRGNLTTPVDDWTTRVTGGLEAPSPLLPAPVAGFVATALPQLQTVLGTVKPATLESTEEEIRDTLRSIHNVRREIRRLVLNVRHEIEEESEFTIYELESVQLPDKAAVSTFREIASQAAGELGGLKDDPEAALELLSNVNDWLGPLNNAWKTVITNQDASDDVLSLIEEAKFTEAARVAARNIRMRVSEQRTDDEVLLGGGDDGTGESSDGAARPALTHRKTRQIGAFALDLSAHALDSGIMHIVRTVAPMQTGWLQKSAVIRRNRAATIALTAMAGIVLLVVGYLLFVKDFVGTVEQMVGIVIWAYGLDITIDKGLEEAKKIKN